MIAALKPYAEYKESGLPWLGQVPGHWNGSRVKNLAKPGYKTFVDGDWIESAFIRETGIRLIQTGNIGRGIYREKGFRYIDEATFQAFGCTDFLAGDVLICRLGDPVGRACLAPNLSVRMITSVDVCILKTRHDVVPAFVVYVMSAPQYLHWVGSLVRGSTRDRVSRSMLGAFVIPLPPPAEQAAIVRFLDWANGRLERAIRAKRKVIALLNEQKQAIIHRAVTRGLDQAVPLKPSGIPWLGDIPQHWGIVRNMALFAHRVEAGIAGLPILQVSLRSGITAEGLDQFGRPKRLIVDPTKYKRIYTGDIAYNTMRMWQGAVGVSPSDGLVSPAYVVLDPRRDTCPDYYDFIFHTDVYKQQVNRQSTGIVSDRNRLYWDSFKQMPNVFLPRSEQEEIVAFVLSETSSLNTVASRLEREIDLLREYRTRLVSDVVTGKLDVREAAARLPDEAAPDIAEDEAGISDDIVATDEDVAA